jgi:hypothetical protein
MQIDAYKDPTMKKSMSAFAFSIIPFSVPTAGSKDLLPRTSWSLYKIYWETQGKRGPKIFQEQMQPHTGWSSSTIFYNKETSSIDDPFGWNKNLMLDESTFKLLFRALQISPRVQ